MAQLTSQPTKATIPDEQILVVKRNRLLIDESFIGCRKINFEDYLKTIQEHKEFLSRAEMEVNPSYKQIIPYLIFTYNNKYFLMQRKSKASEQRLKNKFTLGIGGHIRKEDLYDSAVQEKNDNILFDWAKREFYEEVFYNGHLEIEPLCLINDDSNEVGKVHIGFAFLLHGDSENIKVKSELQSGYLASIEECLKKKNEMESWSQMVFEFIVK